MRFKTRGDRRRNFLVCSWWREIALSTPQLWKEICLLEHCSQGVASLLPVWLSRAGLCGLTISIRWWEQYDWDAVCIPVWNAIQLFAHRVACLRLHLTTEYILRLSTLRQVRLPALKDLQFSRKVDFRTCFEPLVIQDITVFTEAPALDTIDLDAHCVPPVPWTQLKSIRLFGFTFEACLLHIHQAVNLTHCALLLPVGTRSTELLALPPLHSLVSLRIGGEHDGICWQPSLSRH
ncbi:hypothetical protein DFH06DRAFT_139992 [Mycena polygramma]|nr:hypothetical protein DFH06DRAFT_139992 [Mycena polygramma]